MLSEDTASGGSFHSRLASVMAVAAQSAVAEISKLYDDGLLVLRLEVCRKDSEIETLKTKLETAENELRLLKESQRSETRSSTTTTTDRLRAAPCARTRTPGIRIHIRARTPTHQVNLSNAHPRYTCTHAHQVYIYTRARAHTPTRYTYTRVHTYTI